MPWREMSPMEQRADFVREFEGGLFTMTELAAQYGISRKTGYKWVVAYEARGLAGLQDRRGRFRVIDLRDLRRTRIPEKIARVAEVLN